MSRKPGKSYSKRWIEERAARKKRRDGLPPQPRDDLGFIICDLKDSQGVVPKAGRKFDTKQAYRDALYQRELEAVAATAKKREKKSANTKKKEQAA